jgi:predicted Zn-dependent protease
MHPRWLTAALVATVACATNPATGKQELSLVSEGQEVEMGQQEAQKVVASMPVLQNEQMQNLVKQIGMEMAKASERPDLPWNFTVLDDPVVNAFALPGGPIFVTRGILTNMNSEAELASVVGHEIGHVTARHSASQMSKQEVASLGLGVASILSPTAAQYAGLAQQGLQVLFLKYSRDDESQADGLGYRYMMKAKWDPREAVKMFEMLKRTSGGDQAGQPPEWMSTHPDPGNRAARATARLKELQQAQINPDTLRRNSEEFLRAVDGLAYGEDPRQGFFKGSTFYHPELALQITFPEGWQLQNSPQAVLAGEPQGRAMVQVQLAKGNPDEAIRTFFSGQGFTGVQELQVNAGGLPARSASFGAKTEQGQIEGVTTFLELQGRTFQVLSLAGQGSLGALDPIHRGVVGSFKRVTDPAILNARAPRIKVVKLSSAMTTEEFNRRYPSVIPFEQVLVMNGLEAGEQLRAGQLVKQVVAGGP